MICMHEREAFLTCSLNWSVLVQMNTYPYPSYLEVVQEALRNLSKDDKDQLQLLDYFNILCKSWLQGKPLTGLWVH